MSDIRVPALNTEPPNFANALMTGAALQGQQMQNALYSKKLETYDEDRQIAKATAAREAIRTEEKHVFDLAKSKADTLKLIMETKGKELEYAVNGMMAVGRGEYRKYYGNMIKRGADMGLPFDIDLLPHPDQVAAMDDSTWEQTKNRFALDADTRRKIYVEAQKNLSPASPVGKLMADRDKLPAGDPRRSAFDQAIDKETTGPERSIKSWITPDNQVINIPSNQHPPAGSVPYSTGFSLETGPDGVKFTNTARPGAVAGGAIEKKTRTDVEAKMMAAQDQKIRAKNIIGSFDEQFLTYGGKLNDLWLNTKDKLGVRMSPQDQSWMDKYTTFAQDSIQNLNRYINELSGAAVSEKEALRLSKSMPDFEKDGPTKFRAKLLNVLRKATLAEARYKMLLEHGISISPEQADSEYGYDRIEAMLKDKANAIGAEIDAAEPGLSPDQRRQKVKAELLKRYGV